MVLGIQKRQEKMQERPCLHYLRYQDNVARGFFRDAEAHLGSEGKTRLSIGSMRTPLLQFEGAEDNEGGEGRTGKDQQTTRRSCSFAHLSLLGQCQWLPLV